MLLASERRRDADQKKEGAGCGVFPSSDEDLCDLKDEQQLCDIKVCREEIRSVLKN